MCSVVYLFHVISITNFLTTEIWFLKKKNGYVKRNEGKEERREKREERSERSNKGGRIKEVQTCENKKNYKEINNKPCT